MKKTLLTALFLATSAIVSIACAQSGIAKITNLPARMNDVFAMAVINYTAKPDSEIKYGNLLSLVSTDSNDKAKSTESNLPNLVAKFAGTVGGQLNSATIKAHNTVFAKLEATDLNLKFTITKFNLLIQKPRADIIQLQAAGNELSSEMRSAMSVVTPGTTVIFYNITVLGPDGKARKLNTIQITAI